MYIIPFGQAYHDINNLIYYDFGIDSAERAIKNEDIVNKNVNFFQQKTGLKRLLIIEGIV